jgi:uridylate kinase
MQVLTQDLGVMDHSAISLARENSIPIAVFSIYRPGAFADVLQGKGKFTIVQHDCAE